jgi:hypothetical protein
MAKKDDREAPFSYRPPAGKGAGLRADLKARGISFNALVTSLLFGQPLPRASRTPPVEKEALALILARLAALRDLLEAALQRAGDDASVAEAITAIREEMTVLRTAVMKMLERSS